VTDVCAWYHLWADGAWEQPLAEWQEALAAARFTGERRYGLVGTPKNALRALGHLTGPCEGTVVTDKGFEQVTLEALRAYALTHDGAVIYGHAKGSAHPSELQEAWRRSMTALLIGHWRENLALIEAGYDAVGSHWLTPGEYPELVHSPFFGGNFWMASCNYVRRLPPLVHEPRHMAEAWVGLANPVVFDLRPGWPGDF
jgi:hypothetical protein